MILEGAMVAIAVCLMSILHPGLIFGSHWAESDFKLSKTSSQVFIVSHKDKKAKKGWIRGGPEGEPFTAANDFTSPPRLRRPKYVYNTNLIAANP